MLNPRCPNCSYVLVLLERRLKYKCSKCGKLFLKREVEDRNFRVWNIKQRELDRHNLRLEKKRPRLSKEERKLKAKEWRLKNIERCRESCRDYYDVNRSKILAKKKVYNQLVKSRYNVWQREYRKRFPDKLRLIGRLKHWRKQQTKLALKELEMGHKISPSHDLESSFPTFGLSELLIDIKVIKKKPLQN